MLLTIWSICSNCCSLNSKRQAANGLHTKLLCAATPLPLCKEEVKEDYQAHDIWIGRAFSMTVGPQMKKLGINEFTSLMRPCIASDCICYNLQCFAKEVLTLYTQELSRFLKPMNWDLPAVTLMNIGPGTATQQPSDLVDRFTNANSQI